MLDNLTVMRQASGMTNGANAPALDSDTRSPRAKRPAKRPSTARRTTDTDLVLAPELDRAVGFRLRRATSIADALFEEVFAPLDITTQQYAILMTIRRNPGCRPSSLSALLNITPNNMVPHIEGLAIRGYVERTESTTDRRIKHLRLTKSGEAFAELLTTKHEEVRARVETRMGADNVAQLLTLLSLYSE